MNAGKRKTWLRGKREPNLRVKEIEPLLPFPFETPGYWRSEDSATHQGIQQMQTHPTTTQQYQQSTTSRTDSPTTAQIATTQAIPPEGPPTQSTEVPTQTTLQSKPLGWRQDATVPRPVYRIVRTDYRAAIVRTDLVTAKTMVSCRTNDQGNVQAYFGVPPTAPKAPLDENRAPRSEPETTAPPV
ncbi:hypothetical protein RvY_02234 [Ramazzottius varieornatus]|uniref:Uncharacterized protein n=1 Tax=Ramazzottius varieornatus TaxID=947166 RepID=A0A1D1UME3_RAMVA|nr:hypothetical protein RvY_02234 [Ramazzottius varieornatus]